MTAIEYSKYCGCQPETVREQLPSGSEGLTIAGIECPYRKLFPGAGWQSMCSAEERKMMGCES